MGGYKLIFSSKATKFKWAKFSSHFSAQIQEEYPGEGDDPADYATAKLEEFWPETDQRPS